MANGFSQNYGIDDEGTFALVTRLISVKSLLLIVIACHWTLFQMDVKNFFLNEDISMEIYLISLPCYPHALYKVCKLRGALYSLKQAPHVG